MDDCIFCKIARKEVPVQPVYEDEQLIAFPDIKPAAPVHVLIITKKHLDHLLAASPADAHLLSHIMLTIPKIATKLGLAEDGFRVVINTKNNGGQTVYHLHIHLLGGRFMTWPPG